MKKIGVLTFHCSINYGAVLQCIALTEIIKREGIEVEVINYCPPEFVYRWWRTWKNPVQGIRLRIHQSGSDGIKRKFRLILIFFRDFIKQFPNLFRQRKDLKYDLFVKKNLTLTKSYYSIDGLRKRAPNCNIYIVGSDQVWSSKIAFGYFDDAYFLKFGPKDIKRYAYAASTGAYVNDEYAKEIIKNTYNFSGIAVREKSLCKQLNRLGATRAITVLDPTLLLDSSEWVKYEKKCRIKYPYLLIYTLGENEEIYNTSNLIAKGLGVSIIDISPHVPSDRKDLFHDKYCAPDEFLWYIHHAEFIVTDSFHGTVFSILYRKQFLCFSRKGMESRIDDLLSSMNLEERKYNGTISIYNKHIDYSFIEDKLANFREISIEYIKDICRQVI